MPLPEIPAYSRGLLPYLRPLPFRTPQKPLPFYGEYDPMAVGRSALTGRPYLRPLWPRTTPSQRSVWKNGRWELVCPYPGCGFTHPSGIAQQAHWQRVHQSKNDPDLVLAGPFGLDPKVYRASDWHRGGAISDVLGRQETLRRSSVRAYEVAVRGQECRRENTARFARHL